MLSIARLRVGAEAYQLTGVAQSLGDYYSGSGEAAGWWAGHGAEHLGLVGEVDGEDLRAVLAGIEPGTGGLSPNGETIRAHRRRVPGFDFTFKTPKSVSVLYAVSDDPRVQGAIIDAADTALRDTLGWVEREVIAVRRGSDDRRYLANLAAVDPAAAEAKRLRVDRGADLIAAVFRHRTSRAGDPLLHWHVLVPNLVRGADGRWSAFVHPDLYRLQKAAGEVFQAALWEELSRRLGMEWRPGRHVGELDGIPQSVLDGFSKRSAEIDAWLDDHGRGQSPAARQEAVLATRRHKAELEGERFDTAWKLEGARLGFGPDHAENLTTGLHPRRADNEVWKLPERSTTPNGTPYSHVRTATAEEWIADLLGRDLLTGDAAFTAAQLYQAVAAVSVAAPPPPPSTGSPPGSWPPSRSSRSPPPVAGTRWSGGPRPGWRPPNAVSSRCSTNAAPAPPSHPPPSRARSPGICSSDRIRPLLCARLPHALMRWRC